MKRLKGIVHTFINKFNDQFLFTCCFLVAMFVGMLITILIINLFIYESSKNKQETRVRNLQPGYWISNAD